MEMDQGFTISQGENYHIFFKRVRRELENANRLTKPGDIDNMMHNFIKGIVGTSNEALHTDFIPNSVAPMTPEAPTFEGEQVNEDPA